MPAETYANVAGAWRRVPSELFVCPGGQWHNVNFGYVNVGGGWRTFFIRDVDGPPAPTPEVTAGTAWPDAHVQVSYGGHYDAITYTAASYIQASYNGGGWQTVYTIPSPGNGGVFNDNITGKGLRGCTVAYRMWTIDALGNQTVGAASGTVQTKPLGAAIIWPLETISWRQNPNLWRTDTARIISGMYGAEQNYGFWFYGTQLVEFCRGWAPDRMQIILHKVTGFSLSGVVYLAPHNGANRDAGVPGVWHEQVDGTANIAVDSVNHWLPSYWLPNFANATFRGVVAIPYAGQPFKALYSKAEDSYSGALTVYFD